ncbi:MAG: hypothetical protein ACKOXF_07580 [Chitinophagaceae bacterium]
MLLLACNGIHQNEQKKQQVASEIAINNDFTKIVRSLCSVRGDMLYTDSNTTYFSLSEANDLSCFVFASEIVCGGASGTCGRNIEVYQKQSGQHQIVYQNCGYNLQAGIDQQSGIRTFKFSTRDGLELKVSFKNGQFTEDTLNINGLDFGLAKTVSKILGVQITSLYGGDYSSTESTLKVWQEPFKLSENKTVKLVTVNTPGTDYFLIDSERVIMHVSDIYSFEVASHPMGNYPALKVYDYQHIRQTRDTSFFEGSVYRFDFPSGRYLPE